MTKSGTFPAYAEPTHFDLAELMVAYDFSGAADCSLKYAVMLAKRFGSIIHLIGVQSPADYASALDAGPWAMEMSQRDLQVGLQDVADRLRAKGVWCDSVRRIGTISDTLEGAILEHAPDLLFLGAFGFGKIDRLHLGSTAEHLLRTARCPAFVLGPHSLVPAPEAPPVERILCATSSFDTSEHVLGFAARLAARLRASLELIRVVDAAQQTMSPGQHARGCEDWCNELRERGIPVSLDVIYGRADQAITARAVKSKSSLILFGLHRSGNQMIDCPDGVVSATIRQAHCPVMTVPPDLPHR
ncbi:MAG TPA: universal stress protein [Acidobacteriaceae bacterium]|nr:universal stress protein [Acidobacteriaceae bacterium]